MFARLKNKLSLIFTKSWSFLRPKKKLGLVSFVILSSLFVTAWLVLTPPAKAILGLDVMGWFADIFFALAEFCIKLTFWVLKFVIEVAGYNGYIDSPAVTVGWVMVRDMTNMIFIVVLLIISFGTILGLEHYEYKKLLVKVLMAAVIVNFSRIICGVIIDIAQVVMLTFVNGIAATAAGNLTQMFSVQEIFKLSSGGSGTAASFELNGNAVFLASVAALVFGVMMLITMATFLFLLMARMAMLWVLIVLSPFAFVLNVLPQTEKYASQWWGQFGGHVIGGPVVVFFLWLSFVTVGAGTAHDEIRDNNALKGESLIGNGPESKEESIGITNVMSWAKMANFAIAIAMLLAGAKMATELGMAGGEMMGKAKDVGKKVAMYASGFQAARWGAGKAVSGAKAAGKFALMKAPVIGGDAWIRKGKVIGGWAGTKLEQFQFWRNERAKNLENSTKKISDLDFKLKNNQISPEDYAKEMMALKVKNPKKLAEMQDKMKDLKDKKEKGEISEEDYKAGMVGLGQQIGGVGGVGRAVGRFFKNRLAGVIETGGRKMDRADNWMEAYEQAKERTGLEYSNSSFAGGQLKREMAELKEGSEETKKAKGERKRAEMRVGALRDLAEGADTALGRQAANMVKAEMQLRDWKGQVEVAKTDAEHEVLHRDPKLEERMRTSEAQAKAAKEGHHADEESKMMEKEMEILKKDVEELEKMKVGSKGESVTQIQEEIDKKRGLIGLLGSGKGKSAQGNFDSAAALKLLAQIRDASKEPDSDKQKALLDAIQADGGMQKTYEMMFGSQKVEDMIADERNLETLESIAKKIDEGKNEKGVNTLDGKNAGEVLGKMLDEAAATVKDGVKELNHVWQEAAHKFPSIYAARSSALRDYNYEFYRGKKQEVKDNASQAEVWDKMGIETPSGAAQQAVVDGLYGKVFKDMNYNQLMAAFNAHKNHVTSKGTDVDDKDRLIGMAIMEKMLAESWVDDGQISVNANKLGLGGKHVTALKRRRGVLSGNKIRLSKDDISTLAGGFGGLEGLDQEIFEGVRKGEKIAVDKLVEKLKRSIDKNPNGFMGKKADEIVHLIQKADSSQYNELVEEFKKKLKP